MHVKDLRTNSPSCPPYVSALYAGKYFDVFAFLSICTCALIDLIGAFANPKFHLA